VKIRGSRTLGAPRAAVFDAICDPTTLLGIIPGCREIERINETEYRGRLSLRLPGMVGSYETTVRLVETDPPSLGRLDGEVVGALGSITGSAQFRLTESGRGTTVDYEGTAVIGGPLARLDSRFVEGLARSLIDQGMRNLDARLEGEPAVAVGADGQPVFEEGSR
jgi:carbon monoxide dehydrogenase subunit G